MHTEYEVRILEIDKQELISKLNELKEKQLMELKN